MVFNGINNVGFLWDLMGLNGMKWDLMAFNWINNGGLMGSNQMVFNGINNDGFMGFNGIKWEDVNFITSGKLT